VQMSPANTTWIKGTLLQSRARDKRKSDHPEQGYAVLNTPSPRGAEAVTGVRGFLTVRYGLSVTGAV
jgi:hypothetical protein